MKSQTIEISFVKIWRLLQLAFILSTSSLASQWIPIQDPFTKTLVPFWMSSGEMSQRDSTLSLSNSSTRSSEGEPTDTNVIRERFLTRPHAWPSGVSAGQTIPQCVLCSYQGFVSFPDFANGVFSLLRWERVEANVSRLTTWETPFFAGSPCLFLPQFPVAKE